MPNRALTSTLVVGLLLSGAGPLRAASVTTTERSVIDLAPGVHVIRHPDAPDGFPQGNTTVVIGERGALVVDSCLLPSSAQQDIEQIRRWTKKPVLYLVNTHWHFDHTLGNRTYAEAFPGLSIIAHAETRRIIGDWNPGAMARYPKRAERFRERLKSGKTADGKPMTDADRKDYEKAIAGIAPVVEEFSKTSQRLPDLGFRERLDVDLGGRRVEIRFLGRGNTAGDTVVFLPDDSILMAGDLVVHPVPYLFGGFPVDFVTTLRALLGLGAKTIVPGHGEIQRDRSYVDQLIELMDTVNREMEKEINDGLTLEEAQERAPGALDAASWRRRFAGDSEEDGSAFDSTFAALVKASYTQIKMR